jgi:membrane-associated protein
MDIINGLIVSLAGSPWVLVIVLLLVVVDGFSRRRFFVLTSISGVAWAAYSILVGIVAGAWVHDNPLLGIGIAVGIALIIGVLVDTVGGWLSRRRTTVPASHTASIATEPVAEMDRPVFEDARIAS